MSAPLSVLSQLKTQLENERGIVQKTSTPATPGGSAPQANPSTGAQASGGQSLSTTSQSLTNLSDIVVSFSH